MSTSLQGLKPSTADEGSAESPPAGELTAIADAAMERGLNGASDLPASLRPAFEAILAAFQHYEAGRDDDARESLQSIALASPFLEWKLLLRGLIAFSAGDNNRALENWSRLSVERRPARLIAPVRFAIDPAFQAAQPPKNHQALRHQFDRLFGPMLSRFLALQASLGRGRYAEALRESESLITQVKREWPEAVDQLVECLHSALVNQVHSRELSRIRKLLPAPTYDPNSSRFQALSAEIGGEFSRANRHWANYIETIDRDPSWPAEDRPRAQALIWCRMAQLADSTCLNGQNPQLSTEDCYLRASKLAPDLLEPLEQLFLMYKQRGRFAQAIALGKQIVGKFPVHAATLESLAELCHDKGEFGDAYTFAKRALDVNPLNKLLRRRFRDLRVFKARALCKFGDWPKAREELEEANKLSDGAGSALQICALGAATAFKVGDDELAQRRASEAAAIDPIAGNFALLVEAARFKHSKSIKSDFERQFIDALTQSLSARSASLLAQVHQSIATDGSYLGAKGHEKKIRAYLDAVIADNPDEADLQELCGALISPTWMRQLRKAAAQGQKRFPRNPHFPYFEATALCEADGRKAIPIWRVESLLENSRRLAQVLPMSDSIRQLFDHLECLREKLVKLEPIDQLANAFIRNLGWTLQSRDQFDE